MGILDKIKNIFTDEEDTISMPPVKPIVKEEVVEIKQITTPIEEVPGEKVAMKNDPNFKFPVIFEEEDFIVKEEPKKPTSVDLDRARLKDRLRKKEEIKKEDTQRFRSSPIISPIYGVLDKNYKKEDVTSRKDDFELKEVREEKRLDFDAVRQKAYGTLVDDIEDTLFDNKALFYNLKEQENVKPKIDGLVEDFDILLDKHLEDDFEDFGVEYRKEELTIEIPIEEALSLTEEVIEQEEKPKTRADRNKDELINDDLFNLIDSMYKEEEENE